MIIQVYFVSIDDKCAFAPPPTPSSGGQYVPIPLRRGQGEVKQTRVVLECTKQSRKQYLQIPLILNS
jgi:hypothetical protein